MGFDSSASGDGRRRMMTKEWNMNPWEKPIIQRVMCLSVYPAWYVVRGSGDDKHLKQENRREDIKLKKHLRHIENQHQVNMRTLDVSRRRMDEKFKRMKKRMEEAETERLRFAERYDRRVKAHHSRGEERMKPLSSQKTQRQSSSQQQAAKLEKLTATNEILARRPSMFAASTVQLFARRLTLPKLNGVEDDAAINSSDEEEATPSPSPSPAKLKSMTAKRALEKISNIKTMTAGVSSPGGIVQIDDRNDERFKRFRQISGKLTNRRRSSLSLQSIFEVVRSVKDGVETLTSTLEEGDPDD